MITTRIDLIRHGEPLGGNVFRGHVDPPLTEVGYWQFSERLRRFHSPWTQIVTSPLVRCADAAAMLAQQRGIPVQIAAEFIEIHYGDWEGRLVSDVLAEHNEHARQMWQDPLNFCAPGGEPVMDFQRRIVAAWEQLLRQYAGGHLLLVCHGGVMRMLAQHLLSLAPDAINRLAIPYAGLMRFKIVQDDLQNKTQHEFRHWVSLESMDGTELHPERQAAAQTASAQERPE